MDHPIEQLDRRGELPSLTRRGLLRQFAALGLALAGGAAAYARLPGKKATKAPDWDAHMEMVVDFEIAQPDGFRYHRPYVAVWLEDRDGKAVRTLSLWVENSGRGFRWLQELRRWFRDAQDTQAAGGPDLVATVSSATRMPGRYTLVWDGKDDRGRLVPQGAYTLNLEAAREHGPYGLLRQEVTVGSKPFKVAVQGGDRDGGGDILGATVEFRKRLS